MGGVWCLVLLKVWCVRAITCEQLPSPPCRHQINGNRSCVSFPIAVAQCATHAFEWPSRLYGSVKQQPLDFCVHLNHSPLLSTLWVTQRLSWILVVVLLIYKYNCHFQNDFAFSILLGIQLIRYISPITYTWDLCGTDNTTQHSQAIRKSLLCLSVSVAFRRGGGMPYCVTLCCAAWGCALLHPQHSCRSLGWTCKKKPVACHLAVGLLSYYLSTHKI